MRMKPIFRTNESLYEMDVELSIIVPIYNVEPYLERCLQSILTQTFSHFELILVDDGSPDRCGEIIEEYAKKDSRVIATHQNNKGVSAARNAGLRIAKGRYIGFVDPDDWIDASMYEVLIGLMKETDSDIAVCPWRDCYPDGREVSHEVAIKHVMNQAEFCKEIFAIPRTVGGSNCNKVFKRNLIKSFFDETINVCEDNLFLCMYSTNIKKACYTTSVFYNAFVRAESELRANPAKATLGLKTRRRMIQIMTPIGTKARRKAEADYLDNCIRCMQLSADNQMSEYYSVAKVELINYMVLNLHHVVINNEIIWKTKILYLMRTIAHR